MHKEGSPEVFEEIDENLRKAYEELLNEDLPNRFVHLLQELRSREADSEPSFEDDGETR